jgi:hypothetical protein
MRRQPFGGGQPAADVLLRPFAIGADLPGGETIETMR